MLRCFFTKIFTVFKTYSSLSTKPNSSSCSIVTSLGASIKRSWFFEFLGNGMTSLIDFWWAKSIINLSKPNAIPQCGGTP